MWITDYIFEFFVGYVPTWVFIVVWVASACFFGAILRKIERAGAYFR